MKRDLSPRELEVAMLIAQGLLNKEISRKLNITVHTVKRFISLIFEKTGCRNRVELAIKYHYLTDLGVGI